MIFKHSLLTDVLLILSLSSTSLALTLNPALNPALNPSPLAVQPSTNLTIPNHRIYHCTSPAIMYIINPADCYVAVNNMLTTPDASKYLIFGSAGDYRGPYSWTYFSCKITLNVDNAVAVRSALMLFAQAAAEITHRCHASVLDPYTGGTCSWPYRPMSAIRVTIQAP